MHTQQLCISLTTFSFFFVFSLSICFGRIIMKTLSAFILDLQERYICTTDQRERFACNFPLIYLLRLYVCCSWKKNVFFLCCLFDQKDYFLFCSSGKLHKYLKKFISQATNFSLCSNECNLIAMLLYECSGSSFS